METIIRPLFVPEGFRYVDTPDEYCNLLARLVPNEHPLTYPVVECELDASDCINGARGAAGEVAIYEFTLAAITTKAGIDYPQYTVYYADAGFEGSQLLACYEGRFIDLLQVNGTFSYLAPQDVADYISEMFMAMRYQRQL
jgi:hypothetical protein